jgi:Glycosyl transferase family 2
VGYPRTRMTPSLSVVIPADHFETVADVIASLRGQSERGAIELVLVSPSAAILDGHDDELEGLHSAQVVEGSVDSLSRARATGVRAARAEVVAFVESHSFPEPGWAAALIAAHRGTWAAVGPVMRNAKPGKVVGDAVFFIDYGPWAEPVAGGSVADLPGHNSSYKRDLLLDYGAELGPMLDAESILHWDLRGRGHALYLEPAARIRHVSTTGLLPGIATWFYYSRGFATARRRHWGLARRLAYAAGAPLIFLIRLRQTIAHMRRAGMGQLLARALPALLLMLGASAAGELVGYTAGGGEGSAGTTEYELHRARYAEGGYAGIEERL